MCDPMDCSPSDFSVRGILQARILEWVAISISRGSFQNRVWTYISCIGRWILYNWASREAPVKLREGGIQSQRGEKGALWSLGSWHSPRPRPQVLRVHWVRMVNSYSWVGQKLRCAETILGWTLHFYTLSWSALNTVILFPPFLILREKMEVQKT